MPTREEIMRQYNPEWRPVEGSERKASSADEIKRRYAQSWGEGVGRSAGPPPRAAAPVEEVPPVDMSGSNLQFATPFGTIQTPVPLPEGVSKGFAQVGSGIKDYDLGFRQIIGKASKEDAAEKRKLDKPLTEGIVGTANQFLGKALPTMALPYGWAKSAGSVAGPLIENVAGNVAIGALEPVAPGESRALNMGVAGVAGAVPSGATALARRSVQLEDDVARLAASAQRQGIPLAPADVTSNRLVKAFRSVADDSMLPGVSSKGLREEQQQAFNRAMGSKWGSNAAKHTPDVRAADKTRIVNELDRIWGTSQIPYQSGLDKSFADIRKSAAKYPGLKDSIDKQLMDIEDLLVPDANGILHLPGEIANNTQKKLRQAFEGKDDYLAKHMMDARKAIIDNFNATIPQSEAKALTEARKQYRAYKTFEDILDKGDVGTAGRAMGDIPPALASEAVRRNWSNPASSPFDDLPRIGQRFLVDRTAQTGGSPRAAVQNSLIGSGLLTLGGLGTVGVPFALPALATAGSALASGAGLAKAINSPKLLRALQADPYDAARPIARELALRSVARLPAAGAVGGLGALTATEQEVPYSASGEDEEE